MGWIGSPEDQRRFEEKLNEESTRSSFKRKLGVYFACRFCQRLDQCMSDCLQEDETEEEFKSREGCSRFESSFGDMTEEQIRVQNKSW